jgi:hypothetical protein
MNALGDTAFERGANALSFVPGVGFLGNAAMAGKNLITGHPWKALGDAALTAGSLFSGGAVNDAVKGIGAAGRIGKMMPTFAKGVGALNKVPKAVMGMKPLQNPAMQSLAKHYPSQWVSGGQNISSMRGAAKNIIGSGTVRHITDNMDASQYAPRDNMFNGAMNAGRGASEMMGGMNGDPRYLTPKALPAPFSPMFGQN